MKLEDILDRIAVTPETDMSGNMWNDVFSQWVESIGLDTRIYVSSWERYTGRYVLTLAIEDEHVVKGDFGNRNDENLKPLFEDATKYAIGVHMAHKKIIAKYFNAIIRDGNYDIKQNGKTRTMSSKDSNTRVTYVTTLYDIVVNKRIV